MVTEPVATADCSHSFSEPIWVEFLTHPAGFTDSVTTVSCIHVCRDYSQMGSQGLGLQSTVPTQVGTTVNLKYGSIPGLPGP